MMKPLLEIREKMESKINTWLIVWGLCFRFFSFQSESKTPKQRLLGWIQHKVPDMPIKNFSQDWSNGRALGALVDSCAPGTLSLWESVSY